MCVYKKEEEKREREKTMGMEGVCLFISVWVCVVCSVCDCGAYGCRRKGYLLLSIRF